MEEFIWSSFKAHVQISFEACRNDVETCENACLDNVLKVSFKIFLRFEAFWILDLRKHCAEKGSRAKRVMIARGAMWTPSIFSKEEVSFEEMLRSYVRRAVQTNATYQNTKWLLSQMLAARKRASWCQRALREST